MVFVLSASEVDSVTLDEESEVESMVLCEEHELCSEGHVVGVEGSGCVLVLCSVEGCGVPFKEIRCVNNLSRHNSVCGGGPEIGVYWMLDGLMRGWSDVGTAVVGCFMWFVKGAMGVLFGLGIFMFWMTFSFVGGYGGPEMFCGPEMVELLCGCSVAYVDGLGSGDGESMLMGLICCLLCLYLWPWASMRHDLSALAWPMTVPSRYDTWSTRLLNRTSCPGIRSGRGLTLCLLS